MPKRIIQVIFGVSFRHLPCKQKLEDHIIHIQQKSPRWSWNSIFIDIIAVVNTNTFVRLEFGINSEINKIFYGVKV